MSRSTLRPSPNEEAQIVQDELQRRRKLRILQVREQEKANAIRIRRATQEKHEKEINVLAYVLEKKWRASHKKELKESEEQFASCLEEVGSAHEDAKENEPNQALKDAIAERQQKDAINRGEAALTHERHLQQMRDQESIEIRRRRHVAMIKERVRAKHIANLPPPHPNPADFFQNDTTSTKSSNSSGSIPNEPARYATIRISNHESTMTTAVALGLPSDAVVERATAAEVAIDAREEAVKEGERIALLQAEKDKATEECMEKARVRHQAALEEARLDKESKTLMNDLKQLTMKDGLRRQYHIDYKWDDNIQAKKACQELFGPPGSQFKESEMLSRDLQHTNIDVSQFDETYHTTNTTWKDVSQEEAVSKPGAGRVLNRLLKQIDAQRQQHKNGSEPDSNSESKLTEPITENHEDERSHEHDNHDDDHDRDSETEAKTPVSDTTADITEKTDKKLTTQSEVIALKTTTDDQNDILQILPKASPKTHKNTASGIEIQTTNASSNMEYSSDRSKSQSELLLESGLQSMRNDQALLKSVKDFQQRLLEQHKSSFRIQEQINRLESKRAAINAQVEDVIKK